MPPNRLLSPEALPGTTQENALAPAPTWADAYENTAPMVQQHFADQWADWQRPQFWEDTAGQYANALMMGTTAPGLRGKVGPMTPIDHMLDQISRDPKAKWGLRVVPDPVDGGPGTVLPPSRVWDDGKPTDKSLPGTSTIGIAGTSKKHLEAALTRAGILPYGSSPSVGYYPGEHVVLVKGTTARRGYDDLERIIPDAEVVSTYRKANDGRAELLPMEPRGLSNK